MVIVDGKTMPGMLGRLLHPLIILEMKTTVLGDPDHDTFADLKALTSKVQVEEELFGTYFICQGRKRIRSCDQVDRGSFQPQ
jgi:hypothetical protein